MADEENLNVNEDNNEPVNPDNPDNPNEDEERPHGLTIDDPYMFGSWEELVSLSNNNEGIHYFKIDWEVTHPVFWQNLFIDEQIRGTAIKYIDWDGCYIRNLFIRIPYNDQTKDRGASSGYYYTFNMAFVFKDYSTTAQHWRNLEVENMYVYDPRVALFRGKPCFHNCHFNNVVVKSELLPTSSYWLTEKGENGCPFGTVPLFSECMIFFHSKNVAPRVPFAVLYSSYLYVDYVWDLNDGTLNDNGVIPRSNDPRIGEPFQGWNSILDGIIDISGAKGTVHGATGNFKLVRDYIPDSGEGSPRQTTGVKGVCGSVGGGTNTTSLTITLKTKTSENNKIAMGTYQFGNSKDGEGGSIEPTVYGTPVELVTVRNYGDGYAGTTEYSYLNSEKMSRYQLMNPDYLDDVGYNYVRDDLERFNMFWNDFPHGESQYVLTWLFMPQADPNWVKRKNPCINNQFPFLPFEYYPQIALPVYNGKVNQNEYIIVYDMKTSEYNFNNQGLAVLEPTSCRVVEELNGAFNVTLTHPKDENGKYQYLLEMNLLKVLGQIFVIQRVEEVTNGGSHYVSVYAEHVTYTLDDRWLFPPITIAGYTGQTLIDSIMEQSYDHDGGWQVQYEFNMTSDIEGPESFEDYDNLQEGSTPYELIIGPNGLAARLGGELYRDNFHVSINKRMENAIDNAFELKIGYNLTGVKRTVDLTTFCTYLRCFPVVDGEFTGEWWAVAWDARTLPRAYPREVVRSLNFYYTREEYETEGWWGKFTRDGLVAFSQRCQPQVSYELNLKDLKKNPDYQGFDNEYRFKVGDMGKVWDERTKMWVEVEISRTEKNGITGETEKVVIGNLRRFTRPTNYNPIVPSDLKISTNEHIDGYPPYAFVSDGSFLSYWLIQGAAGGVGEAVVIDVFDYDAWQSALLNNKYTVEGVEYTSAYGATIEVYENQSTGVKGFKMTATKSTGYTFTYSLYGAIPIYLEKGREYTVSWEQDKNTLVSYFQVYLYKDDSAIPFMSKQTNNQRSFTFTMPSDAEYICIGFEFKNLTIGWNMLITNIKVETTTYRIPIRIRQNAQNEQTVYIPIEAPLGRNDTVSCKEISVAIPTYIGLNYFYVDTEVRPYRVAITYSVPVDQEDLTESVDSALPIEFESSGDDLFSWTIYGAEGGVGDLNDVFDLSDWLDGVNAYTSGTYTGFVGGTITPVTDGFTIYCDGSQSQISYTLSASYPSPNYSVPIEVPRNTPCVLKWEQDVSENNVYVMVYESGTTNRLAMTSDSSERALSFTSPNSNNSYVYVDIQILFAGPIERTITYTNMKLIAGDPSIPVTITGSNNRTTTVNIPFEVPIEEGQSISFSSTNTPIPTFEGENTITVGTSVQPSHMAITYVKYVEPEEPEGE